MIVRHTNGRVFVIDTQGLSDKEYLQRNPSGGFRIVNSLPDAPFPLYREDDNGGIIPDIDRIRLAWRSSISDATSKLLDDTAAAKGYDSMQSARSYAGFDNPFRAEALALAEWSARCWEVLGELWEQVIAGELEITSPAAPLTLLPTYPQ